MDRLDPPARVDDRAREAGRIRVVTLVDKLSLHGGAERLALMTATRLDAERFESFFCVSRWPPPPGEVAVEAHAAALARLEAAGTRFIPLGRKRKLELGPW